jgi:hypothetical protein
VDPRLQGDLFATMLGSASDGSFVARAVDTTPRTILVTAAESRLRSIPDLVIPRTEALRPCGRSAPVRTVTVLEP